MASWLMTETLAALADPWLLAIAAVVGALAEGWRRFALLMPLVALGLHGFVAVLTKTVLDQRGLGEGISYFDVLVNGLAGHILAFALVATGVQAARNLVRRRRADD